MIKICQHLEANNSVNQFFSKQSVHYVAKSCVETRSTQSVRRDQGFSIIEYVKFVDLVSDSTLRCYHLSSFSIVSKKNIHNYLKGCYNIPPFSNYISV